MQVQESNTRCANQATLEKLTTICRLFTEDSSYFTGYETEKNNKTAACCDSQWNVPEDYAICGKEVHGFQIHGCVEEASYWTFDKLNGINIDVIILCVNVVLFWVILIFIETNVIKKGWIKLKEMIYGSEVSRPEVVDEDVQKERDSIFLNNNLMKVVNLTKKFGKFDAVRGLTFGVREKECFGLLGVNGAGKTTTFR